MNSSWEDVKSTYHDKHGEESLIKIFVSLSIAIGETSS